MPDSKITALTALTAADPANDMFPIVDVSDTSMAASGTTKRISINNILACSPAATLASLNVTGSSIPANGLYLPTTNTLEFAANSLAQYRIAPLGVFSWYDGAGGTRMTLNATGLGVGGSPASKLSVFAGADGDVGFFRGGSTRQLQIGTSATAGYLNADNGSAGFELRINGTARAYFDTAGQVGIGVAPSAWDAGWKSIDINAVSSYSGSATGTDVWNNARVTGATSIYKTTAAASFYRQTGGVHYWFNAPSGTAGNAITFTQAMTLDASGNLLVGTTSALASGNTFQNLGSARQVLTLKGDDQTSYTLGVWSASATGDNLFQYFGTEASLTVRGGISYNRGGGLVAYNTTSDYRAKDIIGPVSNSGSLIDSLKVYVGKMKGATIERPMLIAHEAQEVAPYAVTGTKDEVDADGNPKYQQMDVSALVPVLIAEIQSLRARVQTLEAK